MNVVCFLLCNFRGVFFFNQVLVCRDVSFPRLRQNGCADRFYWQLGSGNGDGTVRNEVWCRDLCGEGEK